MSDDGNRRLTSVLDAFYGGHPIASVETNDAMETVGDDASNLDFSVGGGPEAHGSNTAEHPVVGGRWGPYDVTGVLGSGSFGVVYSATDRSLRREVAVKIPHPGVLAVQSRRRRFRAEALAVARLDHPAIQRIHHVQFDDGIDRDGIDRDGIDRDWGDRHEGDPHGVGPNRDRPADRRSVTAIISARCDGPDLATWLAGQPSIDATPWRDAVGLVATLADGVHHAHVHGVIHRDIKPSNVLLHRRKGLPISGSTDGLSNYRGTLVDFGLARLAEGADGGADGGATDHGDVEVTASGLMIGTPLYMAPEQADCDPRAIGPWSDVYSLGVILYELLTGRPPHDAPNFAAVLARLDQGDYVRLERRRADLPADLATVVECCLRRDPTQRYRSAAALRDDLRRLIQGDEIQARPLGRLRRWSAWWRHPRRLAEACEVIQFLAFVRVAYAYLGYFLLLTMSGVRVSPWDLTRDMAVMVFIITPLDVLTYVIADRHRRVGLAAPLWWSALLGSQAMVVVSAWTLCGRMAMSDFYSQSVEYRILGLSLVLLLFVCQSVAWCLADRRGVSFWKKAATFVVVATAVASGWWTA